MSQYDFKCDSCGSVRSITASINNYPKTCLCKECNTAMYRIYKVNIGNREYAKPLHSDSLAVSPSQRAEHRKHFPNIELDKECRPVFHNFKEHDDYLKKTGFIKAPQKIKPKGKKGK